MNIFKPLNSYCCFAFQKAIIQEIPWRSSGEDLALSLTRARVQSLVGELRSHKLHGVAKKKKKERKLLYKFTHL